MSDEPIQVAINPALLDRVGRNLLDYLLHQDQGDPGGDRTPDVLALALNLFATSLRRLPGHLDVLRTALRDIGAIDRNKSTLSAADRDRLIHSERALIALVRETAEAHELIVPAIELEVE
jgi:hypothetical protein